MFSLIITIISIALVAALALATLYYGSDAFERGSAAADAAKLYTQAQQLQGAAELYKTDTGAYPTTLAQLVGGNYLKSIPVAHVPGTAVGVSKALAAATPWVLVAPGEPVFALAPVTYAVCAAVNNLSYGINAVLLSARESYSMQCFGTNESDLTVVTAKSAQALTAAAVSPSIALGAVITAAIPADLADTTAVTGWLRGAGPAAAPEPRARFESGSAGILSTLSFIDTPVGSNSDPLTVVVRNTGTADLVLTGDGIAVQAPFSLASNTCAGATVAPAATCTVTVVFSPTGLQPFTGALEVTGNPVLPASLPVVGKGVALGITKIVTGKEHTVVLRTDGSVWATGNNLYGQLGNGAQVTTRAFVKAQGLPGRVTDIAAGDFFTLVLSQGSVYGVGRNEYGQLGDGSTTDTTAFVPTQGIVGTPTVLATGGRHSIVIAGGAVWTAGHNSNGQLGDGTNTQRNSFGPVQGIIGTPTVAAGGFLHTVVIANGLVYGAGNNLYGQLADGLGTHRSTFFAAQGVVGTATAVDAGLYFTVVIAGGTVQSTGQNMNGQLGDNTNFNRFRYVQSVGVMGVPTAVTTGNHHTTVIAGGVVQAVGYNLFGQLGDDTTNSTRVYAAVPGVVGTPTAIASGDFHTSVVLDGSTVVGVGYNAKGSLGDGTVTNRRVIVPAVPF